MKNIIVPIDFSELSYKATKIAFGIAQDNGGSITLLNAVDFPLQYAETFATALSQYPDKALQIAIEESREKLSKWEDELKLLGANVETISQVGLLDDVMKNTLEAKDYDLVVSGTHGAKGLEDILIGTNTERFVRNSKIPVLSIPDTITDFDPRRVLLVSDFAEEPSESFEAITQFIKGIKADLFMVRLNSISNFLPTDKAENKMQAFVEKWDLGHISYEQVDCDDFESGVRKYAKRIQADLILIGTHGRTGISHILNGSQTEELVNHLNQPVLSYHI